MYTHVYIHIFIYVCNAFSSACTAYLIELLCTDADSCTEKEKNQRYLHRNKDRNGEDIQREIERGGKRETKQKEA